MNQATSLKDLRGELLTPYISSAECAGMAFAFWLIGYRPGLTPITAHSKIAFTIVPLEGDLTGQSHFLSLPTSESRVRLGELLWRYPIIGPCKLVRTWIMPGVVVWDFATPEGDTPLSFPTTPEDQAAMATDLQRVIPV